MTETLTDAPAPATVSKDAYTRERAAAWPDLDALGAERLLVLVGGASALLFGLLTFVLAAVDGRAFAFSQPFGTGGAVITLVLTLFFGVLLLHAMVTMARKPVEGSVLALAFALVLLIFGGMAGMVGGILGLVGGAMGLLRNGKWS
jgi:hypothetical protein